MKKSSKRLAICLVLPAFLLVILLFLGLFDGFIQSLGYFPGIGLNDISLAHYRSVLQDPAFRTSLGYSFYLAFLSAFLSVVLGIDLSYLTVRLGKTKSLFLRLPVAIPHVVVAFMVSSLISQTGFLSRLLAQFGLLAHPNDFPLLVHDTAGKGIILAYILKQVPYVLSVLALLMERYDKDYAGVARTLGANERQAFWQITLPLTGPTICTAFLILFAYDFGAYELPHLLGATLPEPLAIRAHKEFFKPDLANRPRAMAYTLLLAASGLALIFLYQFAFRLLSKRMGRQEAEDRRKQC